MKNSIKLILLVILITAISCNQNKNNSNPKQDYSETEKLIKEICSEQESYYFNLFKGIKYSSRRGSIYITELNNDHKVHLRKINNQYLYRDSQDTISYDLDIYSKEFENKYEWDIDRAKEFIDFCYEFKLMRIYCREQEQIIGIITLYGDIIYTKEQPKFDFKRKVCLDWYLTGNEYCK